LKNEGTKTDINSMQVSFSKTITYFQWLQPMVDSMFLSTANSYSINKGVITYALPCVLKLYPDCLLKLLEIVSLKAVPGQAIMRALLSISKSGRKLRLITADNLEGFFKGIS
jgi:hypothetical protein